MSTGFRYNPYSQSTQSLKVLIPEEFSNSEVASVRLIGPDGKVIEEGKYKRFADNRENYHFAKPGNQYPAGVKVELRLKNGEREVYDPEDGLKSGEPGPGGASVGYGPEGVAFPQAGMAPGFQPVAFEPIPDIEVPVVDPIDRTREIGDANTTRFQENLGIGMENARDLVQLEFDTLEDFNRQARGLQAEGVSQENIFNQGEIAGANIFNRSQIPAANEFNRGEVSTANRFNQEERLTQLESALPGARDTILRQVARGKTMAEGRLVPELEDRAFEATARNAAGESTIGRGFGDDSIVGQRTSDLLSAQQRVNIGQLGEQTVDRFLTLGANLAFDQPIKQNPVLDQPLVFQPQQTRTSQDVRGAPARPGSELAIQQQESLTPLTTITPAQGITFDIGQNQFQAGLDREADKFNSSGAFEAAKFNSTGSFQAGLEQFYADTFNAQQEAGAINQGNAIDTVQDQFNSSSVLGTIGNVVGTGLGVLGAAQGFGLGASVASGAGSAVGGAVTAGGGYAGLSAVGGQAVVGSAATATGGAGYLLADGSIVAASEVTGATGATAGTATGISLGSFGTAAGIAGVAALTGRGVLSVAQDWMDGNISEDDVKAGASLIGIGGFAHGLNETLGKPVSSKDISQAALLTNPVTAPLAIADMLGFSSIGGGGKSEQQKERDQLRKLGAEQGLLIKADKELADSNGLKEGNYYTRLANGGYADVGKDGGAKIKNYSTNIDGNTERNTWDIDWSDPRTARAIGYMNPAMLMIYGDDYQKMLPHMLNANASSTNSLAGIKQNTASQMDDAGIDYKTGLHILQQYYDAEKLTDLEYASFVNGWNELMLTDKVSQDIVI